MTCDKCGSPATHEAGAKVLCVVCYGILAAEAREFLQWDKECCAGRTIYYGGGKEVLTHEPQCETDYGQEVAR